jgi:hypothetical protein
MIFLRFRLALVALLLGSIAGLSGCHSTTGTVSHEPTAYVKFLNAEKGDTASIDGGTPFRLESGDDSNPILAAPGKHTVQVARSGTVVLLREVLVSDLQTLEIRIP